MRQGQQQTQENDNGLFQFGLFPSCYTCGRNHNGRCFCIAAYFTCGEIRLIAKYYPKGNSNTSVATIQP